MTVTVNGRETRARRPGEYFLLRRGFRKGDVVALHLPMTLRLEPLPNAPEHAAVMFGPIALAARLGTQGLSPGSQLIINERKSAQQLTTRCHPEVDRPLAELPAALTRTRELLGFTTSGFAGGEPVRSRPTSVLPRALQLYWSRSDSSGARDLDSAACHHRVKARAAAVLAAAASGVSSTHEYRKVIRAMCGSTSKAAA